MIVYLVMYCDGYYPDSLESRVTVFSTEELAQEWINNNCPDRDSIFIQPMVVV